MRFNLRDVKIISSAFLSIINRTDSHKLNPIWSCLASYILYSHVALKIKSKSAITFILELF